MTFQNGIFPLIPPKIHLLFQKAWRQAVVSVRLTHGLRQQFRGGGVGEVGDERQLALQHSTALPRRTLHMLGSPLLLFHVATDWAFPTEVVQPQFPADFQNLLKGARSVVLPTIYIIKGNACAPSTATGEKWSQPVSNLTPSVASQGVFGLLVSWHNDPSGLICTSLSRLYQLFIFSHFDISRTSISSQF